MRHTLNGSIRVPVTITIEAASREEAVAKAEKGQGCIEAELSQWFDLVLESHPTDDQEIDITAIPS